MYLSMPKIRIKIVFGFVHTQFVVDIKRHAPKNRLVCGIESLRIQAFKILSHLCLRLGRYFLSNRAAGAGNRCGALECINLF
jgi:hypothetical protein